MPETGSLRGNTRVLSVALHASHPGVVVFDRFGLVDRGFRVFDLHRHRGDEARGSAFAEHARRLLEEHRPAVVLLARAPSASSKMQAALRAVCHAGRVPVEQTEIAAARKLLLGRNRGRDAHALARQLVTGFAPALRSHLAVSHSGHRARAPAWSALAIAIAWLARREPRAAFAMAHAPAFDAPGFAAAIAEADRRIHPHPI